ncbi:hypothetical protein GBA65_15595 [Rubrobacter marinus]|uniref:DUF4267 domain-containing protein n=1 Tax=Rubrobacter marinus TaxID=2653852 RepID=A0A6G8PZW4_9ACTN|nr:hypothetical protein [Rubrobacter marinus]QIN79720.1 hypothetical protein GBA65_15595 [Rubrobacter marinus]
MDERKLARGIGWLSLAVGLQLVVAPTSATRPFGMGDSPTLGRIMGVRDLVVGAGLLRGDTRTWLLARGINDAADAAIVLGGMATGAFPRNRAPVGLTIATSLSVASLLLAGRLK